MLRWVLRGLLRLAYRVEVRGLEHYHAAGERVLIIANHMSFLDAVLIACFLPGRISFAVNTQIARQWYIRLSRPLVDMFVLDPMRPFSLKSMIRNMREDRKVAIFPEGRITVTGSLMKIYYGPGLIADRSGAMVLPLRIDGAQLTPFSRMRGRIKLRWFPKIRLTLLPPRHIVAPPEVQGRQRRLHAGQELSAIMIEMMFATSNYRRTLIGAVLDAMRLNGSDYLIVEDIERDALSYRQLLRQSFIVGDILSKQTVPAEYVGVLLPSTVATVLVFLGLHTHRRVPVMLNLSTGTPGMLSACHAAAIKTVFTSRQFVTAAKLESAITALAQKVKVVFLEDLAARISLRQKVFGILASWFPHTTYRRRAGRVDCNDPAVVLFTAGTGGAPKGVVLSHANILANAAQLSARVDFGSHDIIFNVLPMYHSFGLTAGTLLPLVSGIRTFFYPSPRHSRIVTELVYSTNATIMFGTNTYLYGYARIAHPYDFYSVRYVFAGGERLQEETRHLFSEKFGVRILEGYGTTETSPVLCTNTPMDNKPGSVGRFLPGIHYTLQPVAGVVQGGRLLVKGPNIMLGYLLVDEPGRLQTVKSSLGEGWHDTGDVVSVDENGFVTIEGRAATN